MGNDDTTDPQKPATTPESIAGDGKPASIAGDGTPESIAGDGTPGT